MVGWLAKRAQNSRVYMCLKEVKWELEAANEIRRATILALAQLVRGQMLAETDFPAGVINRPLDYPRDELFSVYEMFETIRNQNNVGIQTTKANMRRIGFDLPKFSEDHARNAGRGIEVWMCTIGAGISPDRRDDVRMIWSYLSGALPKLDDAICELREVERKTLEMTGGLNDQLFDLSDEEWREFCQFIPEVFTKSAKF